MGCRNHRFGAVEGDFGRWDSVLPRDLKTPIIGWRERQVSDSMGNRHTSGGRPAAIPVIPVEVSRQVGIEMTRLFMRSGMCTREIPEGLSTGHPDFSFPGLICPGTSINADPRPVHAAQGPVAEEPNMPLSRTEIKACAPMTDITL